MTDGWENFEKPDTKAARENERHEQERRKQVRHDGERRDKSAPVFPAPTLPPKFTGVDLATFMDVLQHQLCPDTLR